MPTVDRSAPVITVWAAHGGAGASVLTLALADAAQAGHVDVALIDLSAPSRSGLAGICRHEGRTLTTEPAHDSIREGDRYGIAVRRLAPSLTARATPSRLPAPGSWLATLELSIQLVVVDVGYLPTVVNDDELKALTAWLELSTPVVVGRPTIPSLQLCEGALAILEGHRTGSGIHLMMSGAPPWPTALLATAGRRTGQLINSANAIPHDPELEWRGCTTEPLPGPVREAAARLLARVVPGSATPPPTIPGQPGRFRTPFRRRPGRG